MATLYDIVSHAVTEARALAVDDGIKREVVVCSCKGVPHLVCRRQRSDWRVRIFG